MKVNLEGPVECSMVLLQICEELNSRYDLPTILTAMGITICNIAIMQDDPKASINAQIRLIEATLEALLPHREAIIARGTNAPA